MSVAGHSARARLLVVSAHAADFVWRAGGYIALTTAAGGEAHVVCLSFGERGESQGAWKQPGMTLDRVKEIRRGEAETAGKALGATMISWTRATTRCRPATRFCWSWPG